MLRLITSEPAIYGVVLVAGLVVIIGNSSDASWEVLVKVLATLVVFWVAHVYAFVVSHLGDAYDDASAGSRLGGAFRHALAHSWGMLLAGLLPLVVLTLGALELVSDQYAIWGTLWAAVLLLGFLGFVGVVSWSRRTSSGLLGAVITSLIGLALVALKALVK